MITDEKAKAMEIMDAMADLLRRAYDFVGEPASDESIKLEMMSMATGERATLINGRLPEGDDISIVINGRLPEGDDISIDINSLASKVITRSCDIIGI